MREKVRVGVFVCRCGSNIAGVLDVPSIVKYTRTLKYVTLVDEGKWSCSTDYLVKLGELVKEHRINRVVIASCSARTHESLFKQAVKNVGLNPYFLEFVSIREQVSWVHMNHPKAATEKAKDLIKMGVAKAILLEEGFETKLSVGNSCLIIGGGIAGMNAALSIANQGFKATIVEREPYLGGLLRKICFLENERHKVPAVKFLSQLTSKIMSNENVTVFTGSRIESLDGYIGNYSVVVNRDNDESVSIQIDTVIVATGMKELLHGNYFLFRDDPRIMTQMELEECISKKIFKGPIKLLMINCVNSKNDDRGCCNIGCHVALKNAIALKKINYDSIIYIAYRDLSICHRNGYMLSRAKKLGIKFIRFPNGKYPKIEACDDILRVKILDVLSDMEITVNVEKIVLTTAFGGGSKSDEIKGFLKISTNKDNFFQESHVKLKPLEFPSDGIGLAGSAKYPMFCDETFNEGVGAAMRVSIPMSRGYTKADGIVANIYPDKCKKCDLCLKNCPYNAIKPDVNGFLKVIKALCRGCGLCAADCPTGSIEIVHYSDRQIFAQIKASLEKSSHNKIVGFVCHWCALGGVDMAGVGRLQYPSNVRLIRVMCSARVSIGMLEYALKLGAAGVLVAGCEFPTCHYISGNYFAKNRIGRAKKKLERGGFNPDQLWMTWCSAADGPKFASVIKEMVEKLGLSKLEG